MLPAVIIAHKRDGQELSDEQITGFVQGYAQGRIPDYQMAAMAMAIYLNGMTDRETATLTREMLDSGTRLQWPDDGILRVDKHSTGGLGDKTSIILAPLLAACGLQVPMLSGRGLGATGGTLDKLESIPGFRTDLTLDEITRLTQQIGCVITGASAELAPADRRLYALRDVTATVSCIPLITASIMSKKLAESTSALVLDVKFGTGAFMKSQDRARQLAKSLVETGHRMGVTTTALLTDMNQPLGRMCGNAVEILESLEILKNAGPPDARELTVLLATEVLLMTGTCTDTQAARQKLESLLASGAAFERYCQMVTAQGGDPDARLTVAPASELTSDHAGIVAGIDTEQLGLAVIGFGGGRAQVNDKIDHSVGLEMLVRVGQTVNVGQPLVRIFSHTAGCCDAQIRSAFRFADTAEPLPLVVDRMVI